jgi:3-phosphoshikimate 1-carboxyvinyltransferase
MAVRCARAGLVGRVEVPGDKSISHRAVLLGSLADGTTRIRNFLRANDCLATLGAVRDLGIEVECSGDEVLVHGRGLRGLREPLKPINSGGSGTSMRLLAGVLAGPAMNSVLEGNAQLSRRPMDRVAIPLRQIGAVISGREGGKYPPLSIAGGKLRAIRYEMPVASAQVKSALLLAGLFADGATQVVERPGKPTRDHTERMLSAMGASIHVEVGVVEVHPALRLEPIDIRVPGDLSSAAFLLAAAAIVPSSRVTIPSVGVNPGRTGILGALLRMGGGLRLHNVRLEKNEPVADLELGYAPLVGTAITGEEVPSLIDELPLLAVVATQAQGVTEVLGAGELRVKETDRITTTVSELKRMGAKIEPLPDGFIVEGPVRLKGAHVNSYGDHRLAMALAVAALAAEGETIIDDTACIDDSFPGFEEALALLLGEVGA